jgi:hypothetical protein
MNDKDRDLIASVLQAAGKAGERGFTELVDFTFKTGFIDFFGHATVMLFLFYIFRKLEAWKPKEDGAHVARGAGFLLVCVVAVIEIYSLYEAIGKIASPAGAAIHSCASCAA